VIAYFVFATPFTVIDLLGCPEIFRKYKVQPGENLSVSINQVKKCCTSVLFNLLIVILPCECLMYTVRVWRGCHNHTETHFPWFLVLVAKITLMALLYNIIFFYCHYFLHSPKVYKYFHKVHHEWKAPISISSYYAHPIDHFFVNWLDLAIPPLLLGADSTIITIWYTSVLFITVCHHSGFKLPLLPDPYFHDYHHANFTKNYGGSGILGLYLDRLHGTEVLQQTKKE
jgi:methylsterol monooxygenase